MSNGGSQLSVAYDLTCIMRLCEFKSTVFEKCISEAADSTMSQILSRCVEWWSPFVCLRFDPFHDVSDFEKSCLSLT